MKSWRLLGLKADCSFEKEVGSWEMEGKGSGDHRLERRVEDLSMWWLVERDWGTTAWLVEKQVKPFTRFITHKSSTNSDLHILLCLFFCVEVFSSCANNITDKILFPIIASDRPMVHVYRTNAPSFAFNFVSFYSHRKANDIEGEPSICLIVATVWNSDYSESKITSNNCNTLKQLGTKTKTKQLSTKTKSTKKIINRVKVSNNNNISESPLTNTLTFQF